MKTTTRWSTGAGRLKVVGALVALIVAVAFVSVAVAGSLGRVVVTSTPPGANVIVGSHTIGTTPVTLQLPADGSKVRIRIKKKGYKTKSVSIRPKSDRTTRVKVKLKRR